jgi:hypothetical protein
MARRHASMLLAAADGIDIKGTSTDRRTSERHNGEEADGNRWAQPPTLSKPGHLLSFSKKLYMRQKIPTRGVQILE